MKNRIATTWVMSLLLALCLSVPTGADDHGHHYARLEEHKIDLADFTLPTADGKTLQLREALRGKRALVLTFFAAWCHNSNFDVTTMEYLQQTYGARGLAVIGVCEYSSATEMREFIDKHKPTYPICVESDDQGPKREQTLHYKYRQASHDNDRKWGTPLTLLIEPPELKQDGPLIARKIKVAKGEMLRKEAETILQQLPDTAPKQNGNEP
ncbi:MAG: peroxiredoxin family protein [Blastocatellia bacterium]